MVFRNPDIVIYLPDIIWLIGFDPIEVMMTSFVEMHVTKIHERICGTGFLALSVSRPKG